MPRVTVDGEAVRGASAFLGFGHKSVDVDVAVAGVVPCRITPWAVRAHARPSAGVAHVVRLWVEHVGAAAVEIVVRSDLGLLRIRVDHDQIRHVLRRIESLAFQLGLLAPADEPAGTSSMRCRLLLGTSLGPQVPPMSADLAVTIGSHPSGLATNVLRIARNETSAGIEFQLPASDELARLLRSVDSDPRGGPLGGLGRGAADFIFDEVDLRGLLPTHDGET